MNEENAAKSNRTSTMNKDAMNDGEIPMEDPTPYIDKYLVKIRHELDTRKMRKYGRVEGVGVSGRGRTAGTADGPLIEP